MRAREASPPPHPQHAAHSTQLDVLAEVEGPSELVLDTRDLTIHAASLHAAAGSGDATPLAFHLDERHKVPSQRAPVPQLAC